MAKLAGAGPHLAVLLAVFGLTAAVPADDFSGVFRNDDYDDDEFVPIPDKENFDVFDWELCKHLSASEPGNVVVSPVSIKLLLAMLYEGANGNTARELEQTLHLPERLQSRKKFSAIIESFLMKKPEYLLHMATRMYVRDNVHIRPRFTKILQSFYNASIHNIDFDQSEKAVQEVNSWVSEVTHGKIKSMFTEDTINPSTVMLLVNAIYFRGLWRYPFNETNTKDGVFHVTPTHTVTVPLMSMERDLYWTESVELDSSILRLPYMGKKYSMFIVLPNKKDGLNELLIAVSPAILRAQSFEMTKELVDVRLPKFSFEFTGQLGDILKALGLRDIFNSFAANLPGVARDKNFYVSKIVQKAGLEVNEKGTTAFASTGMEIKNKFGGDIYFHATHPFMFFIQDETTGTVIFVGKLINPISEPLNVRMSHQPNVQPLLHGRFGDEDGHRNVPDVTTGATLGSPKGPITHTTVNDVTDDSVFSNDPEFRNIIWTYIRDYLQRLQGRNQQ